MFFFLRILKSYNVSIDAMINFYCAVIERILTTNILVWSGVQIRGKSRKLNQSPELLRESLVPPSVQFNQFIRNVLL